MLVNKQVTMKFGTPLTVVGIQVRHLGTRLVCQKVLERSRTRCWQMAFTVVVLVSCFFWTLRFGSRRDVIRWSRAVPPLYSLMLATSMIALQYASVGAVTVARNVAPLIALPIEAAFQERIETTMWTWISLVYILAGVLLYMSVDVGVGTSTFGLSFIMLNMIAAIVERLLQRKLIALEPVDLSKTAMLLLNNAFALIPVAIAVPLAPTSNNGRPEYREYGSWAALTAVDYLLLVLSCIIGVAIGWTALNAQSYRTPPTPLPTGTPTTVRHPPLLSARATRRLSDRNEHARRHQHEQGGPSAPPPDRNCRRACTSSLAAPPCTGGCGVDQHSLHGGGEVMAGHPRPGHRPLRRRVVRSGAERHRQQAPIGRGGRGGVRRRSGRWDSCTSEVSVLTRLGEPSSTNHTSASK